MSVVLDSTDKNISIFVGSSVEQCCSRASLPERTNISFEFYLFCAKFALIVLLLCAGQFGEAIKVIQGHGPVCVELIV